MPLALHGMTRAQKRKLHSNSESKVDVFPIVVVHDKPIVIEIETHTKPLDAVELRFIDKLSLREYKNENIVSKQLLCLLLFIYKI